MNIAICMYGFLRTFELTANSLVKHVLQVNNADLFIFAPKEKGISMVPCAGDVNTYKTTHRQVIKKNDIAGGNATVERLYQLYGGHLKKVELFDYDVQKFEEAAIDAPDYGVVEPYRFFSMLYQISGAVQLVVKSSREYDWICILRPDLGFYTDIDFLELNPNKIHIPFGGGILNDGKKFPVQYTAAFYKNIYRGELIPEGRIPFTDQCVIGKWDIMKGLASLYDQSLKKYLERGVPLHPETIIYYATAFSYGLEVEVHHNWVYEIVRNNFEPIENAFSKIEVKQSQENGKQEKKSIVSMRGTQGVVKKLLYKILPSYKVAVDNRYLLHDIKGIVKLHDDILKKILRILDLREENGNI